MCVHDVIALHSPLRPQKTGGHGLRSARAPRRRYKKASDEFHQYCKSAQRRLTSLDDFKAGTSSTTCRSHIERRNLYIMVRQISVVVSNDHIIHLLRIVRMAHPRSTTLHCLFTVSSPLQGAIISLLANALGAVVNGIASVLQAIISAVATVSTTRPARHPYDAKH